MIIESKDRTDEGVTPPDAPPAYDELTHPSSFRGDRKDGNEAAQTPPVAGPSTPTPRTPTASQATQDPSGSGRSWFGLGSWLPIGKSTQSEVKQTIQSLIRDVVNQPSSPAAVSVVQSCVEACQARGLSFQSIVSEKFIEGHCPLYWVIARYSPRPQGDQVHLLDIFLSFPLTSTSRSEAYLACLLSSDQALFQRLRHTPGGDPPSISAADELLLGEAPGGELFVENLEGDHGEFRVKWTIVQFQKRMRAIGGVGTEVVARGRIWSLAFVILPNNIVSTSSSGGFIKAGSWVASVSLLAPSPPSHLEAQLSISEPVLSLAHSSAVVPSPSVSPAPLIPSSTPDLPPLPPPSPTPRKETPSLWGLSSRNTQKPPITLPMKTGALQLEPRPLRSKKQDLREHVLAEPRSRTVVVPLSAHSNGNSLQYDGCTYLNPDGSLSVTFEARLAKSGAGGDCIIC